MHASSVAVDTLTGFPHTSPTCYGFAVSLGKRGSIALAVVLMLLAVASVAVVILGLVP